VIPSKYPFDTRRISWGTKGISQGLLELVHTPLVFLFFWYCFILLSFLLDPHRPTYLLTHPPTRYSLRWWDGLKNSPSCWTAACLLASLLACLLDENFKLKYHTNCILSRWGGGGGGGGGSFLMCQDNESFGLLLICTILKLSVQRYLL
jgi:hypothetical protein